jgi:two-component system, OmpR family, response regulator ResD
MVVDDDTTVGEILSRYLVREGYEVDTVVDGEHALDIARARTPDLVVLDLMLPGINGLEVCRRLRRFSTVPVIMLTARGEELDRILNLRLGADDYVVKPFSPRELTARVNSVLRRTGMSPPTDETESTVVAGAIEVDIPARTVRVAGKPAHLAAREFDLLAFLARHPDRVFSRQELLEQVWGYSFGDTATVTVHVRRIRAKIEADPTRPEHLETAWGVGYRFRR